MTIINQESTSPSPVQCQTWTTAVNKTSHPGRSNFSVCVFNISIPSLCSIRCLFTTKKQIPAYILLARVGTQPFHGWVLTFQGANIMNKVSYWAIRVSTSLRFSSSLARASKDRRGTRDRHVDHLVCPVAPLRPRHMHLTSSSRAAATANT